MAEGKKLDKAVVLYFPGKDIGAATGARCGICWKFITSGECVEVEGDINPVRGICGLYCHGTPRTEDPEGVDRVSKEVAGYANVGPTHCGDCEYYGGGEAKSGPCEKVEGTVEYSGCCNHWEEKEESWLGRKK